MALPGESVVLVDTPPSPGLFTNISTLFAIGKSPTPVSLEEVHSIDQFEQAAGARDPASSLYDTVQSFFKEGGSRAFITTLGLSALDAAIEAAVANFTKDLGPGQMIAPGASSPVKLALMAQAAATGPRIAVLDAPDTSVVADVVTAAAALTGQPGDRFSSMFWPWDIVPGLTLSTTRTIPPVGRICGNLARNDGAGFTSNDPAAGENGIAAYTRGLSQPALLDTDRQTLNEAGVNVSRIVLATVRTYGWRTLADQVTDSNWSMLSNSRCIMEITNLLSIMNERFVFSKMDGAGHNLSKYANAIKAVLLTFFADDDLWGASAADAFVIDVGPAYNTDTSIANGELHARVALKTSPFAELVELDVAKVPVTDAIAA